MDIGKNVTSFREELGWTQRELAEKAGVSYSFLNDIENGRRQPSMDSLEGIARALGVRASEVIDGKKQETMVIDVDTYNKMVLELSDLREKVKKLEG